MEKEIQLDVRTDREGTDRFGKNGDDMRDTEFIQDFPLPRNECTGDKETRHYLRKYQ